MKTALLPAHLVVMVFGTVLFTGMLPADVSITELDDRLRVQIDGQTFAKSQIGQA